MALSKKFETDLSKALLEYSDTRIIEDKSFPGIKKEDVNPGCSSIQNDISITSHLEDNIGDDDNMKDDIEDDVCKKDNTEDDDCICIKDNIKDDDCIKDNIEDDDCKKDNIEDDDCKKDNIEDDDCKKDNIEDDCIKDNIEDDDCIKDNIDDDCKKDNIEDDDCKKDNIDDDDCMKDNIEDDDCIKDNIEDDCIKDNIEDDDCIKDNIEDDDCKKDNIEDDDCKKDNIDDDCKKDNIEDDECIKDNIEDDDCMDSDFVDDDMDSDYVPPSYSSDESEIIPLITGDNADAGSGILQVKSTDKETDASTDVADLKSPNNHSDEMYKHNKRHLYKDITVSGYERLNGKRNYSKPDFCLFCKNEYKSKISKHLVAVHGDEARIKEVIDEPIHSMNRKLILLKLQNEGNYQHNVEVLKKGKGTLIVKRRPDAKNSNNAIDYVPCEFCLAFIKDDSLWIHSKSCPFKPENSNRNFLRNGRIMLQSVLHSPETDGKLVDLFSKFKETAKNPGLKEICKNDELIRVFASNLLDRLGTEEEQRRKDKDNIRTKVRSVGRLLRKLNEKKFRDLPLNSYICGREFSTVVNTVKELSIECNSPNLALTLGHYLKQICLLKISLSIEKGDDPSLKQEASDFQQLYNAHWNCRVSAVVLRRLRLRQINKKIELPSTEDLVTLKSFLTTELNRGLPFKPLIEEWVKYAETLITRLVLFNKRRISEVEELTMVDFEKRLRGESANEELSRLDTAEKILAKRMDLIEVRGKSTRGLRKVFVLLEQDMVRGIESLITSRLHVGINPSNKYIFGRSSLGPLDGCNAMRNTVNMCPGLKKPDSIRSTMLRRYLATVSQILDMTGDELKMVADHMGHSIAIHTNIYRTMTSTLERTKVARALIALENGTLQKFQGRNLSSIDVEEIPLALDVEKDDGLVNENSTIKEMMRCLLGVLENEIQEMNKESSDMDMEIDQSDEDVEVTSTSSVKVNLKKKKKKPWTEEQNLVLKENFSSYLKHENIAVRNEDIRNMLAKFKCLNGRTLPQIRSKLNNMKLGKCK
ncbi:hypothetical protein LOTGIDRAFT_228230 [Lottia gigantea]|uniref:Uncharacterized protein n=1 Tax=Lottia gigantea TaxID=225164 RepID=V4ARW4_LOTGI|nr:hypothetical protein LOTGIDRAFT_228230 [Lottia gigantea]ESO97595.1 hypothetical protein LOTGIDRAFT_228230 [Lottia gigantea]